MRTILMATVAASLLLTGCAADEQGHNTTGQILGAAAVGVVVGVAIGTLSDGDHGYYSRDGRHYSYAPGRPRVYCPSWGPCRTDYNGDSPENHDNPTVEYYYLDNGYDGPRVSADPPQLPGFYVDPTTRTTPCGFDLQRCMKNGR